MRQIVLTSFRTTSGTRTRPITTCSVSTARGRSNTVTISATSNTRRISPVAAVSLAFASAPAGGFGALVLRLVGWWVRRRGR